MPESEYSQDNLAAIRTHLNNLEQMVRFNTATNPNIRSAVEALFSSRPGLAELYLALGGEPRTQTALSATLGVNQSTISRTMKPLLDAGLVTAIPPAGMRKTTYIWSSVEPMIGVSKLARAHIAKVEKAEDAKRKTRRDATAGSPDGQFELGAQSQLLSDGDSSEVEGP
jgi:DNA-binding transcriptional ArsR family regulator